MNHTNLHMMHFTEFKSSQSAKPAFRMSNLIWWALSVTEILLLTRLILGYFGANPAGALTSFLYQITDYILHPFTIMLSGLGGDGIVWTTAVAVIGYGLIAVALVNFIHASRSPRSRIEHARALSRKKYSH